MVELNKIYNEDCQEGIRRIPDASVDCILTDPPYLYLKKQKLERPFNELKLFTEFKRVLKSTGFVVMFGRGTSFYRWNTIMADLGFIFKEEIIWDKSYITSPLLPLLRVHETISISSVGKGCINRVKIPYIEAKCGNVDSILQDVKRLKVILHNPISLKAVEDFLINNVASYDLDRVSGYNVSVQPGIKNENRCAAVIRAMSSGCTERSIIRTDLYKDEKANKQGLHGDMKIGNRSCNIIQSMEFGLNEKSIIKVARDHYNGIHPTQKPIRLLERLLALTTKPGNVVLDPFAGSCSTAIACINTNREFIGFEIDKEYYELGVNRLKKVLSEPKLVM